MRLVLDTTVLGGLCHPRKHPDVKLWYRGITDNVRHLARMVPALRWHDV